MRELTYHQKEIAMLVGSGMPDEYILKRYGRSPWKLTKGKLRRWKKNELFNEISDGVSDAVEKRLVNSKARLTLLVADRVMTLFEDELNMQPYDPTTGEGSIEYNRERQLKYGLKMLEQLNLFPYVIPYGET